MKKILLSLIIAVTAITTSNAQKDSKLYESFFISEVFFPIKRGIHLGDPYETIVQKMSERPTLENKVGDVHFVLYSSSDGKSGVLFTITSEKVVSIEVRTSIIETAFVEAMVKTEIKANLLKKFTSAVSRKNASWYKRSDSDIIWQFYAEPEDDYYSYSVVTNDYMRLKYMGMSSE